MLNSAATIAKLSTVQVDWTNVRTVYRKMNEEFYLITEPFGIIIDDHLDTDLGNLIATIDVVDRTLDAIDDKDVRAEIADAIVNFLRCNLLLRLLPAFPAELYSPELEARLDVLREMIIRRDIRDQFADTIQNILFHTESKRTAFDLDQMIHHLVREWSLAGRLTLLILGDRSTRQFDRFFLLCCEMMPAVDMFLDAGSDYRSGQLSVRPTLKMYVKLILVFALPIPKLFQRFPKPMNLLRYSFAILNQNSREQQPALLEF